MTYIDIGDRTLLHVHYFTLYVSVKHVTEDTRNAWIVGSVASLTLAFFVIQYFLINEGISVSAYIFFKFKKKKMFNFPASLTILV